MKITEYLGTRVGVAAKLARDCGLSPVIISKIKHGRLPVTLETGLKLHVGTKGVVSIEDNCPKHAETFGVLRTQIEEQVRARLQETAETRA